MAVSRSQRWTSTVETAASLAHRRSGIGAWSVVGMLVVAMWGTAGCSYDESAVDDPCTSGVVYQDQICRDGAWYPRPDAPDETDAADTAGAPDGGGDVEVQRDADDGATPDTGVVDAGCSDGATRPCYSGPSETADVGVCSTGTEHCRDGTWSSCQGATTPTDEVCGDRKDNDCDGRTDDADLDCQKSPGSSCSSNGECSGTCADGTCAHRIAVTSETWKGKLGGIDGADEKCQRVVGEALPGETTWKAVVSVEDAAAVDRLKFDAPIYNLNGAEVADGSKDLWDDELAHSVKVDETGTARSGAEEVNVWSGTDSQNGRWDGHEEANGEDCLGWTSASREEAAEVGASDRTDSEWIQDADFESGGDRDCHRPAALYCVDGQ